MVAGALPLRCVASLHVPLGVGPSNREPHMQVQRFGKPPQAKLTATVVHACSEQREARQSTSWHQTYSRGPSLIPKRLFERNFLRQSSPAISRPAGVKAQFDRDSDYPRRVSQTEYEERQRREDYNYPPPPGSRSTGPPKPPLPPQVLHR